jgi:hypothetical protein
MMRRREVVPNEEECTITSIDKKAESEAACAIHKTDAVE